MKNFFKKTWYFFKIVLLLKFLFILKTDNTNTQDDKKVANVYSISVL